MITFALAAIAMSSSAMPRVQADAPAPTAAATPSKTKYCVENSRTGTRLSKRECLTRAEWLDRGFDPLVKED